jgi:hypothetical protein
MTDIILKEKGIKEMVIPEAKVIVSGFAVSDSLDFIFCVGFDKGFFYSDISAKDFYKMNY